MNLPGRFRHGQLIEVNAHSLFSKWFSESGKLVSRLFAKILELVRWRTFFFHPPCMRPSPLPACEDALPFLLRGHVRALHACMHARGSGAHMHGESGWN
jgi:hypothetical protein